MPYPIINETVETLLGRGGIIRNPQYNSYRANCANFVSQCLQAGGIQENEQWHANMQKVVWESGSGNYFVEYYDWEDTIDPWRLAREQFNYFSNPDNGYINGDVITITSKEEMHEALTTKNIQKGDLMYFFNEEGVHHATIISNIGEEGILYSANTNRRFDYLLIEALENGDKGVYVVKINDELHKEDGYVE